MSFGGPGGRAANIKPTPYVALAFNSQRQYPRLKKDIYMKLALSLNEEVFRSITMCLRKEGGVNDEHCRKLAKSYLTCRMEKLTHDLSNLMAPDNFENLGLVFDEGQKKNGTEAASSTASSDSKTLESGTPESKKS
ncbi:hypothetical protein RJZ57_002094 [Blastomyces gilchristii]